MQVSAIGNRIANVNPDTKPDSSVRRLVAIQVGNLLLDLHGTAYSAIDAVEHDEQRIAASLDDAAAVLLNRRVDQIAAHGTQPRQGSSVVKPDQAAVADHVGIHDRDQLATTLRLYG